MINMHKWSENIKTTQTYVAAVTTADQDTTGVDLRGYGAVAFLVDVGNSGDTLSGSVKIELEIEESADNVTYTDAANADVLDSVTGTNTGTFAVIDAPTEDSTVFVGQYVGTARYARVVINVTGTHTNGTPIGVIACRFRPQTAPVA